MLDPQELREHVPESVFELPFLRTMGKVVFLIALLAGGLFLATVADSLLLKAAISALIGVPLFTLAAIGHESGHRTASRNAFLNDLIGLLSMSVIGIPARGWKLKHDIHHRATGVPGEDSDTGVEVGRYLGMSPARRFYTRLINEYEFLAWPLTPFLLWSTTWTHALRILRNGREHARRTRIWNIPDMLVAAAFFLAVCAYAWVFGAVNLLLCIALPFGVAGIVGAATFVTNHRNLPPLSEEQQARVSKYFHVNTRTVLFRRWVPGNYFMNYVPWQIEHHMFPTVAGFRLREVSPALRAYGARKGARLQYENFFTCIRETARSHYAWGADGRLYSFRELERLIRNGVPQSFPGRDGCGVTT